MKNVKLLLFGILLLSCTRQEQSSFIEEIEKLPKLENLEALVQDSTTLHAIIKDEKKGILFPEEFNAKDTLMLAKWEKDSITFLYIPDLIKGETKENLLIALDKDGNILDKIILVKASYYGGYPKWRVTSMYHYIRAESIIIDKEGDDYEEWEFDYKSRKFDFETFTIESVNAEKPVIYGYTDEAVALNIHIKAVGEMAYSYPMHNEKGWQAVLQKNGDFVINKKPYPYLFWDGIAKELPPMIDQKGFVVAAEDLTSFLEEKLFQVGLNQREISDFITYWVPRLMKNDYNLIHFLHGEDYDKYIAEIKVSPKPDNMLRFFMYFKEVDKSYKVTAQILPEKLIRKGLTIVEWGGGDFGKARFYTNPKILTTNERISDFN